MEIDAIFKYLKSKLKDFNKTTKNHAHLFTCPNLANHKYIAKSPTATFIAGSDKINCLQCGFKGTFFDVVRLLEDDKKHQSDAEITNYLMSEMEMDTYSELATYETNKWSLIAIAKNSKNPIETGWTDKEHRDRIEWIKWLNNGLNLGLRTGKVNEITVIDVDLKVSPVPELEPIYKELKACKTLMQNTPHGLHFVFKYDAEILQTVNIGGLHIDVRNDGGQIVIQPSMIDVNGYHWINLGAEIKEIPETVKKTLLSLTQKKSATRIEDIETPLPASDEPLELKNNGLDGCCNNTFIQLGGALIKKLTADQTEYVLHLLNKTLLANPMESKAIRAMMGSLTSYQSGEENTLERQIWEFLNTLSGDFGVEDVIKGCFNNDRTKSAITYKYLSQFEKEGKVIRLFRGRYRTRTKINWSDEGVSEIVESEYKVPIFKDIAYFQDGDVLILGGVPNSGKTTIAMNMIRDLVINQNVKPYYLFSESGSRYQKLARTFDITGRFFWKESLDPLTIELVDNAFTIIDWLDFGKTGFEKTSQILEYLATEMRKKKGILVIFTQLKPESHDWFAPNLIEQYPTLSARYFQDNEAKTNGHWDVTKIKEPNGNFTNYTIPCSFDHVTKIFKAEIGI